MVYFFLSARPETVDERLCEKTLRKLQDAARRICVYAGVQRQAFLIRHQPRPTYSDRRARSYHPRKRNQRRTRNALLALSRRIRRERRYDDRSHRSEEHTSELQSRQSL